MVGGFCRPTRAARNSTLHREAKKDGAASAAEAPKRVWSTPTILEILDDRWGKL
jgi:hypothetical protein